MNKRVLTILASVCICAFSAMAADAAADVLKFEKDMEAAVLRGDAAYIDKISAPDFTFTHGDGWITGGAPLRVDDREHWLAAVRSKPYVKRELGAVKVEMHGDIAITYGVYTSKYNASNPEQREFSVWFERVYALRNGSWQFVSHRTVNGPTYLSKP